MKRRLTNLTTILIVLFSMTACTETLEKEEGSIPINPENWPLTNGGIPIEAEIEAKISNLIASMTLEEMVAQTIQPDIASITPSEFKKYKFGSVLNGGNSAPGGNVRAPATEWLQLADEFYAASIDTDKNGASIPLLWGTDAVHGHNNIVGATIFPHNIGLGATRNPDLIRKIGQVTAKEVKTTGMDWTFAPTLAVVRDDRWGRSYEGYSEDPEIVADYAGAMVEGLQGIPGTDNFLDKEHVLACAKHFLGDGGTQNGKDQGDNLDSEEDFRNHHGAGYPPAIEAGVQTVMASFSSWNGQKMHGNKQLLTTVLKERMGFNGFVVGDWNGHGQLPGADKTNSPACMIAGLDMYMAPDSWRGLYKNLLAQVKSGKIPKSRIEDAVRRILRVKFRLGLFDLPKPSERPFAGQFELLGAPDHLKVARQAVRESLVLLKNQNKLLPLSPNQRILVAGEAANNIGKQCGGWTYSWQGTGNANAHFPNGQSIWQGIQHAVEEGGGEAVFSPGGDYQQKPDVAIVVFGEQPYAEFMGDREDLKFKPDEGLNLLKSFRDAGIPTIGIFLSGRPMWVNPEINASDAFVAAWLPGSQGAGIADVLINQADGSINFDFKGKLSFSWPGRANQTKLNRNDSDYDPLFPYGYGLTYSDEGNLAQLSEDSGMEEQADLKNLFFVKGNAQGPWKLIAKTESEEKTVQDAPLQLAQELSIKSVDHNAQEDAKQINWQGESQGAILISGLPVDLSRETNGEMALSFEYRIDKLPENPVFLFMESGDEKVTEIEIGKLFSKDSQGNWTKKEISLSCFAEAGTDMSNLSTVFGLKTRGTFSISFSKIELVSNQGEAICP